MKVPKIAKNDHKIATRNGWRAPDAERRPLISAHINHECVRKFASFSLFTIVF